MLQMPSWVTLCCLLGQPGLGLPWWPTGESVAVQPPQLHVFGPVLTTAVVKWMCDAHRVQILLER